MNRLSYRVVFNVKRGQFVAVAECVASQGKACGEGPRRRGGPRARKTTYPMPSAAGLSALALAAFCVAQPVALAQIIADPNAAAHQRPTVLTDATGRPLINIQTPSAAGVSRNTYSRFDVQSNGIVLNNARGANPWLATGEARVILNEVNSSSPSYLGGAITVNGLRADVVVANPSGIKVDGASFVNISRATLTTGAPVLSGGALTGLTVTKGLVDITSKGLNAKGASFAEILSRSVVINGRFEGDQAIGVTTGAQTVDYATGTTTPLAGTGTQPTLAIDTAALGGMYAGSITLLSTEAGVGVRNQGTLQANTSTGQLVVTADGRLQNTGRMDAAYTSAATVSGNIDNSGNLLGRQLLMASAGSDFNQTGAGLTQDAATASQVYVTAKRDVNLATNARLVSTGTATASGGDVVRGQVALSAARNVNLSAGSAVTASGDVQISSDGQMLGTTAAVSSNAADVTVLAKQGITLSASTVTGNKVHLETGAAFAETASHITITGGQLNGSQQTAAIATGNLNVGTVGAAGMGSSAGHVYLKAGANLTLDAGSTISAASYFTAEAGQALALQGTAGSTATNGRSVGITAGRDVRLTGASVAMTGSRLNTATGSIDVESSTGDVTLNALMNANGAAADKVTLAAGADLNISAYGGSIRTQGISGTGADIHVVSNGTTRLAHATTTGGPVATTLQARGDLVVGSIQQSGTVDIVASDLRAAGTAQVSTPGALSLTSVAAGSGHLLPQISGAHVRIQGGSVAAPAATIAATAGHASLAATSGDLTLSDALQGTARPTITATGNIALHAAKNAGLQALHATAGGNLAVSSATGSISSTATTLSAKDMLSLSSQGAQSHAAAQFTGGVVSIYNQTGHQTVADSTLRSQGTSLASLSAVSGQLSLESGGSLTVDAGSRLDAIADVTVRAASGALKLAGTPGAADSSTSRSVSISTQGGLNLSGASVELQASQIKSTGDLKLVAHTGSVLIDGIATNSTAMVPKFAIAQVQAEILSLQEQSARILATTQYWEYSRKQDELIASLNSCWLYEYTDGCYEIEEMYNHGGFKYAMTWEYNKVKSLVDPINADIAAAQRMKDALISPGKGTEHATAALTGRNIQISAAQGISINGAQISAAQQVDIQSAGVLPSATDNVSSELLKPVGISIAGLSDWAERGSESSANHTYAVVSRPSVIQAGSGVRIQALGSDANSRLVLNDSALRASNGLVFLQSLGDMRLESGQEEFYQKITNTYTRRSWGGLKKKTTTEVSTNKSAAASPVVLEGQSIVLKSGGSIDAFATEFLAPQGNIQITAANALNLRAIDEVNINTFSTSTRSSFLGATYSKGTTTNSRTVSEQLPAKLVATGASTASGWNTLLQGTIFQTSLSGAHIQAGVGPNARADAQIILEGIKTTVTEKRTQESNYVVWQRQLGSGSTVETMTLPSFTGPQRPVFNAPGGLVVQVPDGELRTQIQTLSQQPGMAYLSDLSQRSDVDWQPVKLAFDQWSYKQEGLTPAGAALLSVAVAWATGGMGAGMLGTTSVTTSGAMANAAFMSLSSQAAITLVNNKGNIGKTLSDLARSDTVKATVAAALTAGVLDKIGALSSIKTLDLGDPTATKLAHNLINASGRALTNTAINGGNLEDALQQALVGGLVDTAHGEVASQIKVQGFDYLSHKLAHALAGCVAGAAANGTCQDGAIGAAVGEVVAEMLDGQKPAAGATKEQLIAYDQKVLATSKIVAGAVAAYAGGNAQAAITTAEVAVQNNYLSKPQLTALQNELNACKQNNCTEAQTNAVLDKYVKLSASNDAALAACTTTACVEQHRKTIAEASALSLEVKHQVGNLLASERLIGELQGREKLSTGSTLQQLYARAERIEQARKQLDQYVQSQCVGLSSAACTTKLQSSQATAGVITEIFAGFTPAGIAIDIKDLLQANTMQDGSLAVLGIVLPGLGDGVKALIKGNNALPIAEKTLAANGLKIESNTKHTPGQPGNRYDAGIEPKNSLELFNKSIPDPKNPSIRWTVDENGEIHRFSGKGGDGTFHWNGSTSDTRNPLAAKREIIPQVFLEMAKMAKKG